MTTITNVETGETREYDLPPSRAVRQAWVDDNPNPGDNFGWRGPVPTWQNGTWTCGDWYTEGPSNLTPEAIELLGKEADERSREP